MESGINMNIRMASPDDALNLAVLAMQVWLDTYATAGIRKSISRYVLAEFTPDNMHRILSDRQSFVLVAERDNHLIGFSHVVSGRETAFCDIAGQAEIDRLYIQESFCNAGLGAELLSRTEHEARRRKVSAIWLSHWVRNCKAAGFYRKMGYADRGAICFEMEGEQHENRVLVKNL